MQEGCKRVARGLQRGCKGVAKGLQRGCDLILACIWGSWNEIMNEWMNE